MTTTSNKFQDFGYDVVIPSALFFNNQIELNAIRLYAVIRTLAKSDGLCFASNAYFANTFECDESTIRRWLKSLKEQGYIRCEQEVGFNGKRIIEVIDDFKKSLQSLKNERGGAQKCAPNLNTKKEEEEENKNKEEDPPNVGGDPLGSQIFSSTSKKKKEKKPPQPTSPESKKLTSKIWNHVSSLYPEAKPPKLNLIWERQLDKLHLNEGRSWDDIESMIDFMAAHSFWKTKLTCPGDLVRLWNKLAIQKRQVADIPAAREASNSRLAMSFSDYLESLEVEVGKQHIGLKNGIHYVSVPYADPDFKAKLSQHLNRRGVDPSRIFQQAM